MLDIKAFFDSSQVFTASPGVTGYSAVCSAWANMEPISSTQAWYVFNLRCDILYLAMELVFFFIALRFFMLGVRTFALDRVSFTIPRA